MKHGRFQSRVIQQRAPSYTKELPADADALAAGRPPAFTMFVAEPAVGGTRPGEEAVVGCVGLRTAGGGQFVVDRLTVAPVWRRRGVARALVAHAEAQASTEYAARYQPLAVADVSRELARACDALEARITRLEPGQQPARPPRPAGAGAWAELGLAPPLRIFATTVDATARAAAVAFWGSAGYAEAAVHRQIGTPTAPLALVGFVKMLPPPAEPEPNQATSLRPSQSPERATRSLNA